MMFKRLLSVSGFTLLSRVTGFIQGIVQAAILGSGAASDAFTVALRLPNSFRGIFGEGSFNVSFVPRYAKARVTEGDEEAAKFANMIFSWQMAAQFVILVLAMLFMPQVVSLMALGFAPAKAALATELSRITFPYLILTLVAVQMSAMLNAHERFAAAAGWSILLNVCMIGTLLAWQWFGDAAHAAAWGVLIAGFLQLVLIWWAGRDAGLHLKLVVPRWTPQVKSFLIALGNGTIGSAGAQIALFIDTFIASFLATGVLTSLAYADRINQLPFGTVGIALATVLLPEMSRRFAKGDRVGAETVQNNAAALALFLTLPFVAAFFTVPQTIMRGFFAHGAFSLHAADIAASALSAYGVGLPAWVLVRVVAATFYARGNTAAPARAAILAVLVNVGMKFLLVWGFNLGAVGVALGTSLGSWANVGLLMFMSRQKGLLRIESHFTRAIPAILLAAIATGVAALGATLLIEPHMLGMRFGREVTLAVAIFAGGAAYVLTGFVFRNKLDLKRLLK